jgi:hypothetical protein
MPLAVVHVVVMLSNDSCSVGGQLHDIFGRDCGF